MLVKLSVAFLMLFSIVIAPALKVTQHHRPFCKKNLILISCLCKEIKSEILARF